ncbi:MAG: CsbD family protein [Bdellovibrionota bacterium]
MINENVIKGQWKVIKGEAQKLWGKVTDDEWDQTRGNVAEMEGLLQRKMGYQQDEAKSELHNFLGRFNAGTGSGNEFPEYDAPEKESRPYHDVVMEEDTGVGSTNEVETDKTY